MKTTLKKKPSGSVCIDTDTPRRAGMGITDEFVLYIFGNVLVVIKPQMTANDLHEAADELKELGREFSMRANEICGGCDGEDCPYLEDEDDGI